MQCGSCLFLLGDATRATEKKAWGLSAQGACISSQRRSGCPSASWGPLCHIMSRQWARRAMTVTEAEAGCTGSFLEATGSGKAGLASRKGHADTPMGASGSWCARPADPAPSPAQPQLRPRRPLRVHSRLPTSQQATSKHLLHARSFSRRKRPTKGRVRKGRRGRKGPVSRIRLSPARTWPCTGL